MWGPARRSVPRSWRSTAAVGGLAAAVVALSPPVEHAADHGVAPHMAQHVLLTSVAAPLLAFTPRPRRGPRALRRQLARLVLGIRRTAPTLVPAAAVLHTAVLALWHTPVPYDAAVRSPGVHALAHVTLLTTAVTLWTTVRIGARRFPLPCLAALFGTAIAGAGIGALLVFELQPVYELSESAPDPLADQQLAGSLLWVLGSLAPLIGAGAVLVGALVEQQPTIGPVAPRGDARVAQSPVRPPQPGDRCHRHAARGPLKR